MTIKLKNEIDDYVKWNVYHFNNSPSAKKRTLWYRIIFMNAYFWMSIVIGWDRNIIPYIFIGTVFAIFFFFFIPFSFKWGVKRSCKKMFKEGQNKSLLAENELTISKTELLTKSEYDSSSIKFEAIEKVVSNNDCTYIYIGAARAYVIPKANVIRGDYEAFFKELKDKWLNSRE